MQAEWRAELEQPWTLRQDLFSSKTTSPAAQIVPIQCQKGISQGNTKDGLSLNTRTNNNSESNPSSLPDKDVHNTDNSHSHKRQIGPLGPSVEICSETPTRMNCTDGVYSLVEMLGEGTYGRVHKAYDLYGSIVALKVVGLSQESEGVPSTAIREISLLKELRHPNIIKLFRVFPTKSAVVMAFEFADTDLKKYMDAYSQPLSPRRCRSLLSQLLEAAKYMHTKEIIHRDLKPQNLLLIEDGTLKVGDFGLSRGFGVPVRPFTHEVVTLWYRPPDALLGNTTYTTGLDMWSIGCIFAEMLWGKPLFPGLNAADQIGKIFEILGTPTEKDVPMHKSLPQWKPQTFPQFPKKNLKDLIRCNDPCAIDLLEKLLVYDGSERISASEALQHPYIAHHRIEKVALCLDMLATRSMQAEASTKKQRQNDSKQ